jgi:hypothetical protein
MGSRSIVPCKLPQSAKVEPSDVLGERTTDNFERPLVTHSFAKVLSRPRGILNLRDGLETAPLLPQTINVEFIWVPLELVLGVIDWVLALQIPIG